MKNKVRDFLVENKVIILLSVFFTVIFLFAHMSGDDVAGMHVENGTFSSYWEKSVDMYYTWASRVLVNFVVFIFTDNNPIYWAIFNGISMLVLLMAIKKLFISKMDNKAEIIVMSCLVMLFPYWHLSSAGWMATVTTYFSPIAFGMMSLVPIKKILHGEKFVWWEFLWYLICLIYGANNEQVMVVLLLSYLVAFVWHCVVNKKLNIYLSISTIAAIGSAIFTVTCPGNSARKVSETATWFPAFEHMNIIDKVELGYETVAQWLVFGNYLFFEVICLLLFLMVFLKYEDKNIRILSAIPAIVTIVLGPLKTLITGIYPQIDNLTASVPYWGLANTSNRGGLGPYMEFLIMSICLVLVLVDMFLLCREWKEFVISFTLILGGFCSRLAMGISPTIYASSIRTNAVMCFCIIAVMVYIYSINKNIFKTEEQFVLKEKNVIGALEILALFAAINFVYVVYNTFLS